MQSLEDYISKDHPVRFIDAFVKKLDLKLLHFQVAIMNKKGRPSYESKLFFKNIFVRLSQCFAQQSQVRTRVLSQYRAAMAYPKTGA